MDDNIARKWSNYWRIFVVSLILIAFPWCLGGQMLSLQLVSAILLAIGFIPAIKADFKSIRIPAIFFVGVIGYVTIQNLNPSYIQEWQLGLRVWKLEPLEFIKWLPSSIQSEFTDASPLRDLIHIGTAVTLCLTIFIQKFLRQNVTWMILIATGGTIIALVGLIQLSLESRSILGLFDATDEGFNRFFGTFLYKNHAVAFFNLALAISLAIFTRRPPSQINQKSAPNWIFLFCALLLFLGIIATRSRFGFLCSFPILLIFAGISAKRLPQLGLPKTWVRILGATLILLVATGVIFLSKSPTAKHLKTLDSAIIEDFSIKQRLLAYESGLRMFSAKPIYGWGAGNFRHGFRQFQNTEDKSGKRKRVILEHQNYFWQHAHNDYLEWLIELGVAGTLILFSIPGYFFWRIFQSSRWKEPVPLMLLAGLASTMIHALVDFPFQNPAVLVTWFATLAITTNYCDREKDQRRPPAAGSGRVSIR